MMKSLSAGIRVLKTFAVENSDLSVSDICKKTDLNKSHVSKILTVLHQNGLVSRNPNTRRFSVGPDIYFLGTKYVRIHPLAHEIFPLMRQVVVDSRYSCTLSVIQDTKLFDLRSVEGAEFIERRWDVGPQLPLHTSAPGRVLLSFMPYDKMFHLVRQSGLPRLTPRTITDFHEFASKLLEVKLKGYATTRGEGIPGLGSIAVPIVSTDNLVAGALTIAFPEEIIAPGDCESEMVQSLHKVAHDMSIRLGAKSYPW